jgi:hypothetical protein
MMSSKLMTGLLLAALVALGSSAAEARAERRCGPLGEAVSAHYAGYACWAAIMWTRLGGHEGGVAAGGE